MDVTEHEHLNNELWRRELYLAEAQRLSHAGSFGWKEVDMTTSGLISRILHETGDQYSGKIATAYLH